MTGSLIGLPGRILVAGLWALLLVGPADTAIAGPVEDINQLVTNGGLAIERHGTLLYAKNMDVPLVPASILKIATAYAALRILGPDFRFETRFYWNREGDLFIQGFGDPFLISEQCGVLAGELRGKGVARVRDIVLDGSSFQLAAPAAGSGNSDNPYDAANSGLAVNFNTVKIRKAKDGSVGSAEPQTPFLPLMAVLGRGSAPGIHRINISANAKNNREIIARYAGELFRALLRQQGLVVAGEIRRAGIPAALAPVLVHRSRPLIEMIPLLLKYSNNFIANQIFLACGAEKYGYPATWDKARAAVADFYRRESGFSGADLYLEEGSGLSRNNRVTVRAMLMLLKDFRPYGSLLPARDQRLLKSGTLAGVYAYAGYLREEGRLDRVVIILNQGNNTRERILDLLEEIYRRY
ncbi:MAG: D-alanyl-D-alanine carboxypeptidase [Desulfobacterales bacterium]|nr:D-alanyl-D-alanine carboxypeptidase [Desulfobacterales bacterium]